MRNVWAHQRRNQHTLPAITPAEPQLFTLAESLATLDHVGQRDFFRAAYINMRPQTASMKPKGTTYKRTITPSQ